MQMKSDKKQIEILLDDRDLTEILSGRAVSVREVSVNDQRPLIVRKWLNPELKVLNNSNDLRGIEILTGKDPLEGFKKKTSNVPLPSPVSARPFALEDKQDALKRSNQAVPFSTTGKEIGSKPKRVYPSEFGRNLYVKGGRKIEAPFNRSKDDREEADNNQAGMVGEDNQGSEPQ